MEIIKLILVIYFLGFISTYVFMRKILRKDAKRLEIEYDWDYVGVAFTISTLSWIGFIMAVVCEVMYSDDRKPPKWL